MLALTMFFIYLGVLLEEGRLLRFRNGSLSLSLKFDEYDISSGYLMRKNRRLKKVPELFLFEAMK